MNKTLASRLEHLQPPAVAQIKQKAAALEAAGSPLIYLMRGEPDFETPAHIRQAAVKAINAGKTHYGPSQGIPEMRQAVANRIKRDFGLTLDPSAEVIITTGATQGLHIALQTVINPGDEVIIFDPVYDPYPSLVRMAGGVPVRLPARAQNGHFLVSTESIMAVISQNTKAILLNNPWNPTGTVMTKEELSTLVEIAEAHNLLLIVDEIYESIVFDNHLHHHLQAISPAARARTITINSFSKTYAMTGWRLGYNIAPPDLTQAMVRITQQISRSAATFVQHAGIAALKGPQDPVQQMNRTYARRRQLVHEYLNQLKPQFQQPEGTFFALLDIRPYGKKSQEMADYLLDKARVVTVPAHLYGNAGEGFIRLSFATSDSALIAGLTAIVETLNEL